MNIKNQLYSKFVIINACSNISLILPIRILYMLSFNISYGKIGVLRAIFSITVSMFELPTGIIADRVSRKMSMLFSSIFFMLHGLFYLILPTFSGFIITQICLGLCVTFSSGAGSAYLHDYIETNTKDKFIDVYGKISFYTQILAVIMTLASATLFAINPRLNFILIVIFGSISFLLTLTLPSDSKKMSHKEVSRVSSYTLHIKRSIANMFSDKYLMMIIIFTAINISLLIYNFDYYQIILRDISFPTKYLGLLYASFMLLSGIGAKISNKIVDKLKPANTMRLYALLIVFSYIIFSRTTNLLIILSAILIQQICFGSWNLIIQSVVLDKAPTSDIKSTMASINSLILNLFKAVLVIILSFITAKLNYRVTYFTMGSIITLLIIFEWSITRFNKKNIKMTGQIHSKAS